MGRDFGPAMVRWFLANGLTGLVPIIGNPRC